MRAAFVVLGLAIAGFSGGCRCARAREMPTHPQVGRPAAAPQPATVKAVRFRAWITTDFDSFRAPSGYWREDLWFPDWSLQAGVHEEEGQPPKLVVFPSDFPRAPTQAGPVFVPTGKDERDYYRGPTEEVDVPWELAQRIRRAAEHRAAYEREQEAVGPAFAASGLLRKVPEESAAP